MVHHPWPVAPGIIWHIYLHLYCSSRDGGRDLSSSGEAALSWGRFPVSFEQIGQPSFISWWLRTLFGKFTLGSAASRGLKVWTCHLQGMLLSPCGRSPCTCAAPRNMVLGICHLQGRQPLPWGRSPVSWGQIGLGLVQVQVNVPNHIQSCWPWMMNHPGQGNS